jgi:hypothetical protein
MLDTDLWAKYHLGKVWAENGDVAVGALMTLPTGDSDAGVGFDSSQVEFFGAGRYSFERFVLTANAGVRLVGGGEVVGVPMAGEVSPSAGVGVVWPLFTNLTLIGELDYEGKRFKGGEADTRILAGANWQIFRHGFFRLAIAAGLSDGAPDVELIGGYAFYF